MSCKWQQGVTQAILVSCKQQGMINLYKQQAILQWTMFIIILYNTHHLQGYCMATSGTHHFTRHAQLSEKHSRQTRVVEALVKALI